MPSLAKPHALSQDAIALAFAAQHAGKFKYVATNNRHRWYIFNAETQRWENDTTFEVRNLIRELCRDFAPAYDPVRAIEMGSVKFVWDVEHFAGMDRRFAATRAELGMGPKPQTKKKKKAVPQP